MMSSRRKKLNPSFHTFSRNSAYWSILIQLIERKMGSTSLFKAVFINPEQVVRFYVCSCIASSKVHDFAMTSTTKWKLVFNLKLSHSWLPELKINTLT